MKSRFSLFLIVLSLFLSFNSCDYQGSTGSSESPNPGNTSGIITEPVKGFADIHIHQLAEFAYSGAWFHGSYEGPEHIAMAPCDGGIDHAQTFLYPLNDFLGQNPGTWGDTGLHLFRKNGYPSYEGWPRWDTIAHQQVWEGHLKQAHESGLSLYIMSAVNFRPLSEVMPPQNKVEGWGNSDHDSVDRQLEAALKFAEDRDWVEIARSPEEARSIVNSGKLAMVLAIEISDIFPEGDWRPQLQYYYDLGVRSIQLAHQLDNRFSGIAPHHFIFKLFQIIEDIRGGDWLSLGYDTDEDGKNKLGLTAEGKELVRAMMDLNMIIDLSHISERGVADIYEISREVNYYPLVLSHGHFRSIMMEEKQNEEKTTPDWIVRVIRETGGMFGLRTGSLQTKTYIHSGVPNDCDGSTKTFAQIYQYGVKGLKVNVALASDMNGYIQQIRPRFGGEKESCGASGDENIAKEQQALQKNRLGTEFDSKGFAHIGLIGDIIRELKNFGVDTGSLENSAETFIRVWERSYDESRGPLPTDDFDTSGIE